MYSHIIADVVSKLFPPGSTPIPDAQEIPPQSRFYVIPGRERPRWIVPWQAKLGLAALSIWRPYRPASRIQWAGVLAAYRAGCLRALPGVTTFGVEAEGSWSHLGWTEEPPTPTIYVGTTGPEQKAVCFLTSSGARSPTHVAKAPLGPCAGAAILREAEVLERLADEKPGLAPRVIFIDRDNARAVQETVLGPAGGRRFKPAYLRWLVDLRREGATTSLSAQAARLAVEVAGLQIESEKAEDVLARLERVDGPHDLPAVWVHGDFAPWNFRWMDGEKIAVVDWEKASPDGPPLYDLVHFYLIQDFLFGERRLGARSYRKAAQGYLRALGIDPVLHNRLFELALCKSWTAAVKERETERAALISERLSQLPLG